MTDVIASSGRVCEETSMQPSTVKKRSIGIAGRRTSVSLEDAFWKCLRDIAIGRGETLSSLLVKIEADRQSANLSSAIRLFVLRYYRDELDRRDGLLVSLGLDPSNPSEGARSRFGGPHGRAEGQ